MQSPQSSLAAIFLSREKDQHANSNPPSLLILRISNGCWRPCLVQPFSAHQRSGLLGLNDPVAVVQGHLRVEESWMEIKGIKFRMRTFLDLEWSFLAFCAQFYRLLATPSRFDLICKCASHLHIHSPAFSKSPWEEEEEEEERFANFAWIGPGMEGGGSQEIVKSWRSREREKRAILS